MGRKKTPTFGAAIRAYRKANGMTQQDVAAALGLALGTVSAWERDEDFPRPPGFKKVMDLIGMPEDQQVALINPAGQTPRGSFGHAITVRRHLVGITQLRLADLTDVYPVTVYRWESEVTIPTPENLVALADALEWDLDEAARLCPANERGGRPRRHTHQDRLQWAEDAQEEAARGPGAYRRLGERWGIGYHSVTSRLRVLRGAGYIEGMRSSWPSSRRP